MTDDSDPRRDKTREFLQDLGPVEDEDAGSILTGWVVVQEWMAPDGHKFLTRGWDHAIPSWTAKGMIHEVLYGDWPDGEE